MRVILVGTERERDTMRWRLEGTGVIVVGEFATAADARTSGVEADGLILPPAVPLESARATAVASTSDRDPVEPLTPRELEVLELLAEGLPNKVIAGRLGISDQTVKFHVAQITSKLGVANRTEAVRRAIRRGILAV